MNGIDVQEFILLSQDKYENQGSKQFFRVPVQNFNCIAKTLENSNQHMYEILPQNRHVKPYFDLEMEETDLGIETMYDKFDLFCTWLMKEIEKVFHIHLKSDEFVILNSCRTNKLSFHIIINEKMCFVITQIKIIRNKG